MKKVILTAALLGISTSAQATLYYDTAWGKNCGKMDSFAVKVTNRYSSTKDIRVCVQQKGGGWSCYVSSNVEPGETIPRSWGYSVCRGTGRYWTDVKNAGDYSKRFRDPPGYKRRY